MLDLIPFIIALAVVAMCLVVSAVIRKIKVRLKLRRAIVRLSYSFALCMVCASCFRANMAAVMDFAEKYVYYDGTGNLKLCVQWVTGWECVIALRLLSVAIVAIAALVPCIGRKAQSSGVSRLAIASSGSSVSFFGHSAYVFAPSSSHILLLHSRINS